MKLCQYPIEFTGILLFNRENNTRFSGVDIDQALVGEKLHSLTHGSEADVKNLEISESLSFSPGANVPSIIHSRRV